MKVGGVDFDADFYFVLVVGLIRRGFFARRGVEI